MNLLAFDTSTDVLSVGLLAGGAVLAHEAEGGPRASATLIPAVRALLAQAGVPLASLDAIAFGCGPGSFTGLRTACAVAQGLAFGAGVPVLPVETLLAVAEDAAATSPADRVLALLDARMGEVYAARCVRGPAGWQRQGPVWLGVPEALEVPAGWLLAGNAFAAHPQAWAGAPRVPARPTAAAMLRLAPGLLAAGQAVAPDAALPLYVRDKVAQTTEEREAVRRAAGAPSAKMGP